MIPAWENAAKSGGVESARALLQSGVDINAKDRYGQTALMLAVIAGHTEIARRLARAGADRSLQGSGAPGFAGKTAYDLAVERQMDELYEELRL